MEEHFIITLRVTDRIYRLRVKRKDEKIYRDAVDAIEKKTNQYRDYFAGSEADDLGDKDYLVMTSIQAISEHVALDAKNRIFENKIKALTQELDSYLKKSR